MIVLIHGDHIEASRNELNRLKDSAKDKEVRQLNGRTLEVGGLTQALESESLFGGEILVIIENLFGKLGKKTKLISDLAALITRSAETADIILWEEKEVGATVIKSLGTKAKVQLFKTPVLIFQFLDGLRLGNTKILLTLFEQLVATEPAEIVFVMIVRRLRQLIMLKDNVTPEGLQPWQAGRLTNQAKLFTMEKLVSMYKKLLEIEVSIKSGSSPFILSQLLEQYIITYLS